MATRLEQWSQEEIRAVICFLYARHVSAAEIHRQPIKVYGTEARNRQSAAKWCSDFKSGRFGQTEKSKQPQNKAHVHPVLDNRRVTVNELEHDLGLSHGTIARII